MQVEQISFTDAELIERFLAGEARAFDLIFNKYLHKLLQFSAKHCQDPEEAKEVVMDVLLRFWQKGEGMREVRSLETYLYTAVKHALIDNYRRKALVMASLEDVTDEPRDDQSADTRMIHAELERALQEGIRQLSPQRRLIFRLRREDNLSQKEIALRLGIAPKTVENHLTAAIASLKAFIDKQSDLILPFLLFLFFLS